MAWQSENLIAFKAKVHIFNLKKPTDYWEANRKVLQISAPLDILGMFKQKVINQLLESLKAAKVIKATQKYLSRMPTSAHYTQI